MATEKQLIQSRQNVEKIIQSSIELVEMRNGLQSLRNSYKEAELSKYLLEYRTIELTLPRSIGKTQSVCNLSTSDDLIFTKDLKNIQSRINRIEWPIIIRNVNEIEKKESVFDYKIFDIIWFDSYFWKSEKYSLRVILDRLIEKGLVYENTIIINIK